MFITLLDLSSWLNKEIDLFLYEKPFNLNQLQHFLENRKMIPLLKFNLATHMTQHYKKECDFIKSALEKQAYQLQLKKDQKESQEQLPAYINIKEYQQKNAQQQREARALARIDYQMTKQNIDEALSEATQKILQRNISRYINALQKKYELLEIQIDSLFADTFLTRLEYHISSLRLEKEEKELQSEIIILLKKQKEYQIHEVSLNTKKETIDSLVAQLHQHQKIINQSEEQKKMVHQLATLLLKNRQNIEVHLIKCISQLYYLNISTAFFAVITTMSTIPAILIFAEVISGLTPLLHLCLMTLPTLFLLTTLAIGLSAFFYFCAIKNNQALIELNKIDSETNQHIINKKEDLLQLQLREFLNIKRYIKNNEDAHHEMLNILHEKHDDIQYAVTKIEKNTLSPLIFSSLFHLQKEEVSNDKQNNRTLQDNVYYKSCE